ncbi:MAG: M48 family peptidase, partial [Fluviibacter sp.]
MSDISLTFIALVALNLLVKLWLNHRQATNVRRYEAEVPAAFTSVISLEEHQKAAAYTCAKINLSQWSLIIDTLWLLALTIGGGINTLYALAVDVSGNASTLIIGLVFLMVLGMLSSLIDLPLSHYRQFSLEARFGFNRMTLVLFIT